MQILKTKKVFFPLITLTATVCLSSCGWLNIGADEFECPHIRPNNITCMPSSVIETLDERGKFDWQWHPVGKNKKCCKLNSVKDEDIKGTAVPEDNNSILMPGGEK